MLLLNIKKLYRESTGAMTFDFGWPWKDKVRIIEISKFYIS